MTRQIPTTSSNWRSKNQFNSWLKDLKIPGISGIDTRYLTKLVRQTDSKNALLFSDDSDEYDFKKLFSILKDHPSMKGFELASKISTKSLYTWNEGIHILLKNLDKKKKKLITASNSIKIVALDFGIKKNILRNLFHRNADIVVLPQDSSYEEVMSYNPSGVFLSNGPGDPQATKNTTFQMINKLINKRFLFSGSVLVISFLRLH